MWRSSVRELVEIHGHQEFLVSLQGTPVFCREWTGVSPAARVNQMKHLISFGMTTIGIVAVAALLPSFFGRERSPQLVSDVGAEIRLVACSVTSARTSSLRNAELVTNIVNGLPRDVHVLLMVSDRSAFSASPSQRRVTFVEMPPQSDISIWPQDSIA